MADGVAGRCFISGLHLLGGLCAGGSFLMAVLLSPQHSCFALLTTNSSSDMSSELCDVMMYGNAVVCLFSFVLAVGVNLCWRNHGCNLLHHFITLLMLLFVTTMAAALTMDFIRWCESIKQKNQTCESATDNNVTLRDYFTKVNLEQSLEWAAVPLLLAAVIFYACSVGSNHRHDGYSLLEPPPGVVPDQARLVGGGRYFLVADTAETTPLVLPSRTASAPTRRAGAGAGAESPLRPAASGNRLGSYGERTQEEEWGRARAREPVGALPRQRPASRGSGESSGRRSRSLRYDQDYEEVEVESGRARQETSSHADAGLRERLLGGGLDPSIPRATFYREPSKLVVEVPAYSHNGSPSSASYSSGVNNLGYGPAAASPWSTIESADRAEAAKTDLAVVCSTSPKPDGYP